MSQRKLSNIDKLPFVIFAAHNARAELPHQACQSTTEETFKPFVFHLQEIFMAYYMYKDQAGQWRWYLQAVNGRKIANSGEGYNNKSDCLAAINLVKSSGSAPVYEV